MGFVFRFDKVATSERETFLTGRIVLGELNWGQRVDIPIDDAERTEYSAPLRGVAFLGLDDQYASALADFACFDNRFELPRAAAGPQQFRLILDGRFPDPVPDQGIALGVDPSAPSADSAAPRAGAVQSPETMAAANVGARTPLHKYPYHVNPWQILYVAPWFLFLTSIIFFSVAFASLWNRTWNAAVFLKWASFFLFGLVDVFLLHLSVRLLLSKRSQIVVTAAGVALPSLQADSSGESSFVRSEEIEEMLEYWHKDVVRLISLKTRQGVFLVNAVLMARSDFEELRSILWELIRKSHANP